MNNKAYLWRDKRAAVLSTELILVTAIVVVGSLSGLRAVRETMVDSFHNVVKTVHTTSQIYFDEARSVSSDDSPDSGVGDYDAPCVSVYIPSKANGS